MSCIFFGGDGFVKKFNLCPAELFVSFIHSKLTLLIKFAALKGKTFCYFLSPKFISTFSTVIDFKSLNLNYEVNPRAEKIIIVVVDP